jgi:hypothetical protein
MTLAVDDFSLLVCNNINVQDLNEEAPICLPGCLTIGLIKSLTKLVEQKLMLSSSFMCDKFTNVRDMILPHFVMLLKSDLDVQQIQLWSTDLDGRTDGVNSWQCIQLFGYRTLMIQRLKDGT